MNERYYTFPSFCKQRFGRKMFRLSLNTGMSCPNRDGTCGWGGCIFCDGGSGEFAGLYDGQRLSTEQFPYAHRADGCGYIGYFQANTNTYAPIERLRFLFSSALNDPLLSGISIATRPDCLGKEVLNLLRELKEEYPEKFIWMELGLQTIHEKNAEWMRRGYHYQVFEEAVQNLHRLHIPVIVHVILGLPGEGKKEVRETIQKLNGLHIEGIKLQLLHVLEGTDLAEEYRRGNLQILSKEEYIELLLEAISILSPDVVVHRLTGDGSGEKLLAPEWSRAKRQVLNDITKQMKQKGITQGCAFIKEGNACLD